MGTYSWRIEVRHKEESEAIIAEFQKSEDSQEGAPFKADNSLLRLCMAELRNVLQDPKCYVTWKWTPLSKSSGNKRTIEEAKGIRLVGINIIGYWRGAIPTGLSKLFPIPFQCFLWGVPGLPCHFILQEQFNIIQWVRGTGCRGVYDI